MASDKVSVAIIQEVAKRPSLYASDTQDYKHLETRDMAWRDIAAIVGMTSRLPSAIFTRRFAET